MAEKEKETKPAAGRSETAKAEGQPGPQQPAPQTRRIAIDDRGVSTESCDYWLINSTPEEVILRLGNTKANPQGPVKVNHRIAMSYYTAKRLLNALYQTVQTYEKALGALNVEPESGSQGSTAQR
jgi:hypothetical protein